LLSQRCLLLPAARGRCPPPHAASCCPPPPAAACGLLQVPAGFARDEIGHEIPKDAPPQRATRAPALLPPRSAAVCALLHRRAVARAPRYTWAFLGSGRVRVGPKKTR